MWNVYILECKDGSFYTGISSDLQNRIKSHNEGRGAAYTRNKLPVTLRYHEPFKNKADAFNREREIKKFPRKYKERLINSRF